MPADYHATTNVWINARFLDRPVTGVERVAFELINALATSQLDRDGCWIEGGRRFALRLIAPSSGSAVSPWPNVPLRRAGMFTGHMWEQFDLPRLTFGECLVSLCNTGPLLKRRHALYLHDAQPFAIPRNFSLRFRLWYRFMFRGAGRSAQSVLVNSYFTARELQRHVGLDTKKMTIVSPGSGHVSRQRMDPDALARFDLPEQPFVLAVASRNPNKNFAAITGALRLMGDDAPPCVVVGRTCRGPFSEVNLDDDRFIHVGYVSDDELLALYRRALCLVFPSYYEGFGLPPLEAMASGCPVIASHTSALPEIAGRIADYCDPDDHQSLADAIRQMARYPLRRERMAQQGLRRAATFCWDESATKVMAAVHKITATGGSRSTFAAGTLRGRNSKFADGPAV